MFFIDQHAVHAAAFALAEQGRQHLHGVEVGGALRRDVVCVNYCGQLHVVVHRIPHFAGEGRFYNFRAENFTLSFGNVFKININELFGLLDVNISRYAQDGIVRTVEVFIELFVIGLHCGVEVIHRTDNRVVIRVHGKSAFHGFFQQASVWLVVHALAAFFLHYLALGFDAYIFYLGVQHAFAFEPKSKCQLVAGQHFVVEGAVVPGVGVVVAAGVVDVIVEFAARNIFRPFKKEVFEKVGKTGAIGLFIFRTHVVHYGNGNDWCRVVLVQKYFQAIGHVVFDILDILGC